MASLFSKVLDFTGKDNNFKLKTDKKSIIEAVICQKKGCVGGSTNRCQLVIGFSFVK